MSSDKGIANSLDQPKPKAPIDVLPDNILLEIFSLGARSTSNTSFSFRVSTICQLWRSLAINDPRLWTALSVIITADIAPPPIPTGQSFDRSLVFPREVLISERSGDQDIDFSLEYKSSGDDETEGFMEPHYLVLSQCLANIAHRIRSFCVTTFDWPEMYHLCAWLKGIEMPHLEVCHLVAMCSEIRVYMPTYEDDDETLPVTSQDLLQRGTLQYPALKYVRCAGIPMDWGLFCTSNLQALCIQDQPSMERPGTELLQGILSNSKDTLEVLELSYVVGLYDEEPGDSPLSESRLTLPHVKQLKLTYYHPREAQHVLGAFDFPTLCSITMKSHDEDKDSSMVLAELLQYVDVEQLLDVVLTGISLPQEDFLEQEMNGAQEESLPLVLRFLCWLTCRNLHKLVLEYCCGDFLKFMNYRHESGGGEVNLARLHALIVKVGTEDASVGVMSFVQDRLALGTVDGVYIGPVLEHMIIIVKRNIQEEADSLGDLKLAKDGVFLFCNVTLMN
ncbi:hypothetical protein EDD18DRAFT_1430169 [Armillaria luteobubalina]|uniref:F-box domain-containing protein n=1 Tax=Armillaria luteobubalina TaxID=153913 RepID=A0AA39PH32_9AGAR|nr:hypothetical protein EDD18DRAFT_1430169 [Armillaria luteobubalina]